MANGPPFEQSARATRERLWLHLGNRVRFRRQQLRIDLPRAAAHVGVALQTYEQYEAGERLIPADQLAGLAELFCVPMFYFFEDLQIGDDAARAKQAKSDPIYAIANETDRIAALIEDFQTLDFERQQHLLLVARALANATRRSGTSG
jgi:transcriptional regulator with XRE-family HTH domain